MLLEARKVPKMCEYLIASNCPGRNPTRGNEVGQKGVLPFDQKRESTLCSSVLLNFGVVHSHVFTLYEEKM